MKLRRLPLLLLLVLAAGACAAHDASGHIKPARGLIWAWIALAGGLFGTLFPDTATNWTEQDNRTATRLMSAAILLAGAVLLFDYYYGLPAIPA